jgi:pilus assembly protein CpaB
MRRVRLWMVLLLALASGGLAGYLALEYLREQAAPLLIPEPRRNRVVVAARDLPLGSTIQTEDVRVLDWPGDAIPAGYASSPTEVVGRGVIIPVRANEPLLASKLADREAGSGLPIAIPEGMRAVSVRVDEVVAVAGFVVPGTRVDIMVTISEGGNQPTVTRTVLQNVPVLTINQTIQADRNGSPVTGTVLTVLVTPEQAEALVLVANEGRIQLALRNRLDLDSIATVGARVSTLFSPSTPGATRRAPVTVRRPVTGSERTPTVIETFKGGARTLITF